MGERRQVPRLPCPPQMCDVCLRKVRWFENVLLEVDPDTGDTELTCQHCLDGRTLSAVD